jgi:hypothetical protein
MSVAAIVLAQLGLPEAALWVVRVIAAIGGAFVGWFLSDPIARLSYRLLAHKAIPSWTLPWIKMGGAALCGLLIYFLIPLGGGPGGLGYGPGLGGGPGKGPGEGGKDTGTPVANGKSDDKSRPAWNSPPTEKTLRKRVDIEVLGAKLAPDADHPYLIRSDGKAPSAKPMTLKEVEGYLKEHGSKLELHIILTEDSPDEGLGIIEDLTRLADCYQIPSLVHRPLPKKGP